MPEPSDRPRAGSDATGDGVGLDELFEVLSDRRRRYALYRLQQADGRVRLRALVGTVLAWETDRDPEELPERRRRRTYLEFYHTHVPLLADYGLVSYSEDEGTVRLEPDIGGEPYLRAARADDGIPPLDAPPDAYPEPE